MSSPSAQNPKSGFVAALEYTGIPPSLLKRPKLPGRNWLIFLGVTGSLTGAYVYDRIQCRVLREEYINRVKNLAEEYSWRDGNGPEALDKDAHLAWPRKLTVYAARWPGDEDYDVAMKYFRRYLKPIFVAAAIDYDMVPGKKHGDIALRIADEIKRKRAEHESASASAESFEPGMAMPPQYHAPTPAEREALELAGGTVIIGRATLKEYFSGLVRGWTEPPTVDGRPNWGDDSREEKVQIMLDDSVFDEQELCSTASSSPLPPAPLSPSVPSSNSPLPGIPPVPPLLIVPFVNHLGFAQIPYMLVDFFYRRKHVRDGGDAAWRAVCGTTREWQEPSSSSNSNSTVYAPPPTQGGDLDFALHTESFYRSSLWSPLPSLPAASPSNTSLGSPSSSAMTSESASSNSLNIPNPKSPLGLIQKARSKYYIELPRKLWVAREFTRRGGFGEIERSYTGEDDSANECAVPEEFSKEWKKAKEAYDSDPSKIPPSEVQLRLERFEKEKKWKRDEEGWEIVRPERGVCWDERLGAKRLRVFV
ncbi:inner membrane protein import complex subunit Tim54-domain-containing protein [Lentinula aciculospora]|uniref:Mitochondrial import inner membrane translocase subunit TIM54 n=1 Tax=Lentinula aciculospora TaxID=153920 RepID=A0A9W9A3M8_9AGAR|nr:inner membrane protein import complex subunit Tim54-domain-containing protein [Lentinula aciculospora]